MSTVGVGINTQTIGSLTINPASTLHLAANGSSTTRVVLQPQSLTFNTAPGVSLGTLDIGSNDVDITGNTSLPAVTALVASGYNLTGGARWNGPGITSAAAAADTAHLTAVGVIINSANGSQIYGQGSPLGSFDGANPQGGNDILVKYTYFGDANLDGKIDGSDYSLIDAGYASPDHRHQTLRLVQRRLQLRRHRRRLRLRPDRQRLQQPGPRRRLLRTDRLLHRAGCRNRRSRRRPRTGLPHPPRRRCRNTDRSTQEIPLIIGARLWAWHSADFIPVNLGAQAKRDVSISTGLIRKTDCIQNGIEI